ncbi:hypothetical protein A5787_02895 [Mycobacterium sp. 852002-50816_SCH5313054-b]|uniref:hypothetical protein n=1 Tax=Mycobacterium sp. 852002-50816_SCH5313054-b TaxID=1834092 RepID=UPI0007FC272E|nr:hypothetical protein [Mycobacterium sp. 852002-50816_SCH5313054-b]OBF55693.1 hypothetical protein A5787_02895 [Mycobacterium sp. 852002-50816_SCH5313054-b]
MTVPRSLRRIAAGALISVSFAVAALGLAAGTAQAKPRGPYQWCPGQHLPETDVVWDMTVCHTWYWVDYGFQANRGHFVYEGDTPPPDLGCIPGLCLPGL